MNFPVHDRARRQRGSHSVEERLNLGLLLNPVVRRAKSQKQTLLGRFFSSGRVNFAYGIDRDPACKLATLGSTHAVCYDCEATEALKISVILRFPVGVTVLVILAMAPNIGEASRFRSRTDVHSPPRPKERNYTRRPGSDDICHIDICHHSAVMKPTVESDKFAGCCGQNGEKRNGRC
jgi:hypothetical protein